jgi:hypothetical protein
MDWERVEYLVDLQIAYWRAVGKDNWAETLEKCLAGARATVTCVKSLLIDSQPKKVP